MSSARVMSPVKLAEIGRSVTNAADKVTLLYIESTNAIRAIEQVPLNLFFNKTVFPD